MKCDEFEEQVHRSLDQRAAPWTLESLQQHAQTCLSCRNLLSAYEALSDGMSFFEDEGPDANFSRSVVSQLTAVKPGYRRQTVLVTAVAVIAASVLLLVLPSVFSRPSGPEKAPPQRMASAQHAPSRQGEVAALTRSIELKQSPQDTPNVDQVTAILSEWRNRWSLDQWKPVDRLEGGFAPITTPLSVALDELRSTIPLGRTTRSAGDPSDSAGMWSDVDLADIS